MKKGNILVVIIFLLGLILRIQNVNWDSGFHLHPDERFLTMVGNAMKLPVSFFQYLDPGTSPFNPVNVGFGFFVYGVFPLVLNKIIALLFQSDTYNLFTLQGRMLSAIFDMMTCFFLYRTMLLLERKSKISGNLKYWAVFLYSVSVLPIQLSHFFAADTFLSFFMFAGFYYSLRNYYERNYKYVFMSALLLGLGIATKVNAVLILPLILFFLLSGSLRRKQWGNAVAVCVVFTAVVYAVVRVGDPYYFENSDFFDPTPNRAFVQNIRMLKSFEGKDVLYPPSLQWIHTKPVLFSTLNLAVFGIGIVYFIILVIGLFAVLGRLRHRIRKRNNHYPTTEMLAVVLWVLALFLYQSVQFVKVLRYFIFLYPFFAIIGALGLDSVKKMRHPYIRAVIVILLLIWPVAFSTVYFIPHTRVQASRWINDNVKTNALILGEYWDDPLPLYQEGMQGRQYRIEQLTVFDPDSKEKWDKLNGQLKAADYYILSSNRGWGSIPAVEDRFPTTARFYRDLFAGKRGYTEVKAFFPGYYPCSIFQFKCPRILSDWFDESFTVYDHPTVYIFKNNDTTAQ